MIKQPIMTRSPRQPQQMSSPQVSVKTWSSLNFFQGFPALSINFARNVLSRNKTRNSTPECHFTGDKIFYKLAFQNPTRQDFRADAYLLRLTKNISHSYNSKSTTIVSSYKELSSTMPAKYLQRKPGTLDLRFLPQFWALSQSPMVD